MDVKENKSFLLLKIYDRLNKGEYISKPQLAREFEVNEKSIERDIANLRNYIAETYPEDIDASIEYDRGKNAYHLLKPQRSWLTNKEVLAVCKVLLESRAFNKEELFKIIDKISLQATTVDQKSVNELLLNEKFHYVPLKHGQPLLDAIWELSETIIKHQVISISYKRQDGTHREHRVKPVAIMFSEYYFYLVTFMADKEKDFPTIFRIDRISSYQVSKEKFQIPYKDRFSDGEFRKRVQFMYAGALRTVKFEYSGQSIEAVLDRLPTAEILSESEGVFVVKAEVYGDGIDMWIRSQGEGVRVL